MAVVFKLNFTDAIFLYKKGYRIKSLVTNKEYVDYLQEKESTSFLLSEIEGEWSVSE